MGASANIKPGGQTVPSLRFDSADLPSSIRKDVIREVMSVGYDVGLPEDTAFSLASDAWLLGGMLINSRTCSPIRFSRTGRRIRRDGLDHYMLMVTRAGAWSAELDGVKLDAPGAEVVVFDMTGPLEAAAGLASVTTGVTVPRETLDRLVPGGIPHGTVLRGGAAALLADYIEVLERRLPDLSLAEAPFIERATAEMMAACIAPSAARLDQAREAVGTSLRTQAIRLIDSRLHDPQLTADQVAAALRMSRATLYRLFQDEGGVDRLIWSRRLKRARRLLADPAEHRRISQIAAACGFQSDAHFSRAFRSAFQATPSEVRTARLVTQWEAGGEAALVLGQYRRWMSGLCA